MRTVMGAGVVLVALVAGCKEDLPTNLNPGQTVAFRGKLAAGVECPMLVVGTNRSFSLTGDLGSFKVGDRVCVKGTIAEVSICMAGEATIAITEIGREDACP
jgi:hypothetical protein